MSTANSSDDRDIDMDQDTPIELKGSEQHHKLKNQEGEQGDPEHAESGVIQSVEMKKAVADGEGDTAMGEALKSIAKD